MRSLLYFAMLVLALLMGFYGMALAQQQMPVVVPPPQPPRTAPAPASGPPRQLAPVPFGGLYNVINGTQPPGPGQQAPLTPFNTTAP